MDGPVPLRDAGPLRVLAPLHEYQPGAHPIGWNAPATSKQVPVQQRAQRLAVTPRLTAAGHSGLLAGALAILVLVASIVGVSPVRQLGDGGIGNVEREFLGQVTAPRLAVGGGEVSDELAFSADEGAGAIGPVRSGDLALSSIAAGVEAFSATPVEDAAARPATESDPMAVAVPDGPFLADGTLLKPVAVDTSSSDARGLLINYRVKEGDSLSAIAARYKISVSTLWWANHLATGMTGTTELNIGQRLVVPPVNGVLHVVTDHETLTDIAKRTKISAASIIETNQLTDPTLHVGQWILIPGARNKPVPLPKPAPPPSNTSLAGSSSAGSAGTRATVRTRAPSNYSGGAFAWPVPGGYISQYFHAGHYAIDIAGNYGVPVVAAATGVVVFAGWRNNGGGYQVWLSHGSGLYTAYYHMSAVTVGAGQDVGRGQQVGRLGMTGWATGPHCHFEVWIGPVDDGYRVNPLNYF